MMKLPILVGFMLCYSAIECVPITRTDGLSLRIVHTNDMHARFEETNKYSAPCTEEQSKKGECYGGFARLATLIEEARNSSTPTYFMNGGDTYQGTVYYTKFKWRIVAEMMKLLNPDVISLGNHEFDDGVDGLVPFLNNIDFPVVTANLDLSKEPRLSAAKNLKNSTFLEPPGWKIAVIGFLTPDTSSISTTEDVIFRDEVEAIREEIERIKAEHDVKIFIALGHSGFTMDKKIAEEVEDIDLVIGGHTNTFLYNGKEPDIEESSGFYPTVVEQKSGRKAYVVQAYAYTKYLGNISIDFDNEGEIINIVGNPILVDSSIAQDPKVLEELNVWKKNISAIVNEQVGVTKVLLDGRTEICRFDECNLGNLITDSLVHYNAKSSNLLKKAWSNAAICVHNAGTIRSSITRENNDKITEGDILTVLPFNNVVVSIDVNGSTIFEMLEWSVHTMVPDKTNDPFGGFLQMSGMKVTYDLDKKPFERVVKDKVRVLCTECDVPQYENVVKDKVYRILTTDFMVNGGDGYTMLKGIPYTTFGVTTAYVLSDYLKQHNPVYNALEGRISWAYENKNETVCENLGDHQGNSATTINFQLAAFVLILQVLFFLRP